MTHEYSNVEQRLATLEAQREADRQMLSELRTDMHTLVKDIGEIKNTVVRSRGFIAGVVFVVSGIWVVFVGVGAMLWNKIT